MLTMKFPQSVIPNLISLISPPYSPVPIPSTLQIFQHIFFLISVLKKDNKQTNKPQPNIWIVFCIDLKIQVISNSLVKLGKPYSAKLDFCCE